MYTLDDPKALHIEITANLYSESHQVGQHVIILEEVDDNDPTNIATTRIIWEVLECEPDVNFESSTPFDSEYKYYIGKDDLVVTFDNISNGNC